MVDIIALNQLSQTDQKIFVPGGITPEPFDYSDGEDVERYLHQVLVDAGDLGTRSEELQRAIVDWPSEYHLSSDRANLLRPYNLDGVERVLELGSGCGAISRYLGELDKQVDAVEGSAVRAGLGKLRCRDLENVRVINANFNDLEIPKGYYDLILFIGVIEYARKFHQNADDDRSAAQAVLNQSRAYLNDRGMVFVAIENRLGLKYLLGAHEDHYAKRYIGVNGYRDSAGIATYSKDEWRALIKDSGFDNSVFSYPFPDYKIPRVVMAEDYVRNNPHAANHLEGMVSRDYFAPIPRTPTEMICWQGACSGDFMTKVSNSFSILMGGDADAVRQMQNFDFCHGPSASRKDCFAVTTIKSSSSDTVDKYRVASESESEDSAIRQHLETQPFIHGDLLATQWLRTILIYVRREEFDQLIKDYYAYLEQMEQQGALHIDLLPINIIIDGAGEWRTFDREWEVEWALTKEYLLFRALLTFIVTNWIYLRDFLGWLELQTIRDFIEYGFQINQMQLNEHLEACVQHEDRFQRAIARPHATDDVRQLLATVFDFSSDQELLYPTVYWCGPGQSFTEERKATMELVPEPELRGLRFQVSAGSEIERIRFDPFDIRKSPDTGFFKIEKIHLFKRTAGEDTDLWLLEGAEQIAEACNASSAAFAARDGLSAWFAVTDFPKLEFSLPAPIGLSVDAEYYLDIDAALVNTMEYALAYNRYLVKERQLRLDLQSTGAANESLRSKTEELDREVTRLETNLANTKLELNSIKSSKPFLIGSKLVKLVAAVKKLGGRS